MKIISLFTGIGAFEEALKQNKTPFKVILASDNGERYLEQTYDEIRKHLDTMSTFNEKNMYIKSLYNMHKQPNYVKQSYLLNNPDFSGEWFEDVRFIDGNQYMGQADIVVGGSPCQAFSTYGKKRGIEDARGTLFYEYIRMVNEAQPKAFIYENVAGLLTIDKGKTFERSLKMFADIGYKIKWKVLNAADFNLPQLRRRVFIVGIRNDVNFEFEFPKPVKLTKKVSDYYSKKSIPDKYYLTEKGYFYVNNKSLNKGRAKADSAIMNCQTATQQFNWTGEFKNEKAKKSHNDSPRIYVHDGDKVARKLIPDETIRLMGFKGFVFPDIPDVQKWRQSGNSIAVNVLKGIFKQLEGIDNEKE